MAVPLQSDEANSDESQLTRTIVLKLIHDIRLETASDRTFIIQCLPPSDRDQPAGPTTPLTIEGDELVAADLGVERPPMYVLCQLSITYDSLGVLGKQSVGQSHYQQLHQGVITPSAEIHPTGPFSPLP